MNIQQQKKEMRRQANPISCSIIRFNFGMDEECVWSKIMNPAPPNVNMKLEARPGNGQIGIIAVTICPSMYFNYALNKEKNLHDMLKL